MLPSSAALGRDADLGVRLTPSANRGDISYMLYSFYFFILGLATSFGSLITFHWFSRGSNDPILHPRFWEGVIALVASTGGICLGLAFIFLVLCIQKMNHHTSSITQALSLNPVIYLGYAVRLSFRCACECIADMHFRR